jgi:hypothetical protein
MLRARRAAGADSGGSWTDVSVRWSWSSRPSSCYRDVAGTRSDHPQCVRLGPSSGAIAERVEDDRLLILKCLEHVELGGPPGRHDRRQYAGDYCDRREEQQRNDRQAE